LLSVGLAQITAQHPQWPQMSALAASGYRDLTRLASGDPLMHRDICLTNAESIRPWLRDMAGFLNQLADRLDDSVALHALFEVAKHSRDDWLAQRQQLAQTPISVEAPTPDPALSM
jgi:prephenate dehydrogenase